MVKSFNIYGIKFNSQINSRVFIPKKVKEMGSQLFVLFFSVRVIKKYVLYIQKSGNLRGQSHEKSC